MGYRCPVAESQVKRCQLQSQESGLKKQKLVHSVSLYTEVVTDKKSPSGDVIHSLHGSPSDL